MPPTLMGVRSVIVTLTEQLEHWTHVTQKLDSVLVNRRFKAVYAMSAEMVHLICLVVICSDVRTVVVTLVDQQVMFATKKPEIVVVILVSVEELAITH
jgi:hypothetical protein